MKRFLSMLLTFCLVCGLFPVYAHASDVTYALDNLGMSIDLPDSLVVFTRNIESTDPNLSKYGLTKEDMTSLMLERNIYLNAWDEYINCEITVTMTESPFADYNQFSDTVLSALMSSLTSEYQSRGVTLIKSDLYQHIQAKFMKMYISQSNNGDTIYGLQYNTVYDNKAINITLQSYSGMIDANYETLLKKIVDTIHFDTEPQLIKTPAPTKSFTYTDPNSGLTFTVPANWVESPLAKGRKSITAKFTSNLEDGMCILFSSKDIYSSEELTSELSLTEKLFLTRDSIGNDAFTKADISAMYGCKENDISIVTYGGKEYYAAEVINTGISYGVPISMPMVFLLRCENGYIYVFQFGGRTDSVYYQDFKSLVSSAKFPVSDNNDNEVRGLVVGAYILLSLILIGVICAILIVILRRKSKEKKAEKYIVQHSVTKKAVSEQFTISGNPPNRGQAIHNRFCHMCGNPILSGSLFCNKCGTKIPDMKTDIK